MQSYEELKTLVSEIEADVDKAEGGNKAAGTRVRKQMQKIKQAAQIVRNAILESRSAEQLYKAPVQYIGRLCAEIVWVVNTVRVIWVLLDVQ